MYKFKDKNLATYVQHNCKLYDSKSKNFVLVSNLHCSNALHFSSPLICPFAKHTSSFLGYEMKLCAKFPKFKFRTEMKKYAFPKHATSSELNWVSD